VPVCDKSGVRSISRVATANTGTTKSAFVCATIGARYAKFVSEVSDGTTGSASVSDQAHSSALQARYGTAKKSSATTRVRVVTFLIALLKNEALGMKASAAARRRKSTAPA
jgi:hypothetical protein